MSDNGDGNDTGTDLVSLGLIFLILLFMVTALYSMFWKGEYGVGMLFVALCYIPMHAVIKLKSVNDEE